jgi:lipopolysaccharide/colanic/teichoic acid biosynthesis glycosyltransferase
LDDAKFVANMPVTHATFETAKNVRRTAARSTRKRWRDGGKAVVEWLMAFVAVVVLSPLLFAIAAVIAATTGRPVIHRRRVVGRGGGEFDAFKFRTMVSGAERVLEQDERLREQFTKNWKLFADPRVTRVGRFLRKYSLDELPQLLNVLRGEMALIGPRMISPPELERYGKLGSKLCSVRPGLTGLWQVSGRQTVSYARRIELDMFYIDNCSLRFDLSILVRTLPVVVRAEGAF